MNEINRVPASFRDPSGFVFQQDGHLYRQVNEGYTSHYETLMNSGLYASLVKNKMLVAHQEVAINSPWQEGAYRILEPTVIPWITYPYEWCFSQLKDAALLTLAIQKLAIQHGMTLKDASAYNIQFLNGQPILIDTLSFEIYPEGKPWEAYRQYCQHFLAPLTLMVYRDVSFNRLLQVYLDGIPLELTDQLLPIKAHLDFGLFSHLHLHARAQRKYSGKTAPAPRAGPEFSRLSHQALIENLEATTQKLAWKPTGSEWADYYKSTNYSDRSFDSKLAIVKDYLHQVQPEQVLDLGANTGIFSRVASAMGIPVISTDYDPGAIERNYLEVKQKKETNLLPMVLDVTNPSPGIGWNNQERAPFFKRIKADTLMALALIHHLAISNNLPLDTMAEFFSQIGHWLIIEFVPKEDSQVQRLLQSRRDIFPNYCAQSFESAFDRYFVIHAKKEVAESSRQVYLMENKTWS